MQLLLVTALVLMLLRFSMSSVGVDLMVLPRIHGVIERRVLLNYRADPAVVARLLPVPFRPQLVQGQAIVGICLIRLRGMRSRFVPTWAGLASENAAHRIAVAWDENGSEKVGVYVPRRDTSSRLNVIAGGRLFPGIQHHAQFTIDETTDHLHIALRSRDGDTSVRVEAQPADKMPEHSVFGDLGRASDFFANGSLGWSATPSPTLHHGMKLNCKQWSVRPLNVTLAQSSWFDDAQRFPRGSIVLDHALVMRDVAHEWQAHGDLRE